MAKTSHHTPGTGPIPGDLTATHHRVKAVRCGLEPMMEGRRAFLQDIINLA